MEQIPRDIRAKIKELSEQTFNLLVVEDYEQFHQVLRIVLQKVFPKASISFLKSFHDDDFDNQVMLGNYRFFALDANVEKLGRHSIYGSNAFKAIPFIREHNPDSLIMGMSTSDVSNRNALKLGADFTIEKEHISGLFFI